MFLAVARLEFSFEKANRIILEIAKDLQQNYSLT